jgi:4-amino-4-deoxy-L-arabinose transferase-like glycosyltransferase
MKVLNDILWCLILCSYILVGVWLLPFHGDESTLIYMGRDFYYLINGQSVALQDAASLDGNAATQQELRLLNGTVAKYLYGAMAYLRGYPIEGINEQWAWGSGWQWNHENGHVPSEDLLIASRIVSASLTAIGALAMFGIGFQLGGRPVAYAASLFYSINPAILLNGRRAMMEGSMLAFSLLAVFLALLLLRNRSWWLYLLFGIVSGLAVASKHTSIVTVAALFLACGAAFLYQRAFRAIGALALAGILSLGVFYALNPAWWQNPLEAAKTVLQLRQGFINEQLSAFGGYPDFGAQAAGFARQSLLIPPMYSEVDMDGFLSEQANVIAAYEASGLAGVSLGVVGIVLIVLGIYPLRKHWLIAIWALAILVLTLFLTPLEWQLAILVLTLFLTPLEWQRYYIPIYPVTSLLAALGVDFVLKFIPRKSA